MQCMYFNRVNDNLSGASRIFSLNFFSASIPTSTYLPHYVLWSVREARRERVTVLGYTVTNQRGSLDQGMFRSNERNVDVHKTSQSSWHCINENNMIFSDITLLCNVYNIISRNVILTVTTLRTFLNFVNEQFSFSIIIC